MNGPLVLALSIAILTAVLVRLHGRPRVSAVVATIGATTIGLLVMVIPVSSPVPLAGLDLKVNATWVLLGRSLRMTASSKPLIGFLFLAGAFFFGGAWAAPPGRYMFSGGVVILGLISAAIMVDPFLFAAVFLELAAMTAVLVLSPPGSLGQLASVRLLTFTTIAMFMVLLSGWMLDVVGVTEATPVLVTRVLALLGVGFMVLLLVPPFHSWLPLAAQEAGIFPALFLMTAWNGAGMYFLLRFLDAFEWLREAPELSVGLIWGGLITVGFSSLWALGQRDLMRAGAYLALSDSGVALILTSLGTASGYQLALGLLASRVLGMGLIAFGSLSLSRARDKAGISVIQGAGRNQRLAAAATAAGLLTLSGLPMTAGFPGRWGSMTGLQGGQGWIALLITGSSVVGILLTMRWMITLFGEGEPTTVPVGVVERALMGTGIAFTVLLGVFPQTLFAWVARIAAGFPELVP